MNILLGLIGIISGFLILYFRVQVKDAIGNIAFAERYLGEGGTWSALVLIGIATIILSFLYMTGTLQNWFFTNLGKFFIT